jgi:ribonuclease BN (tRNA processing enzyme)
MKTALLLALLGTGLLLGPGTPAATAGETATTPQSPTRVVILGTAAGRTSWRGTKVGGTSTAISIHGSVYVVDFGHGWEDRYFQAGLAAPLGKPETVGLQTLRAGFITHMHADHVVDYPRLLLFGATDGLTKRKTPVEIYGPGRSVKVLEHSKAKPGSLVNPDNLAPGTVDMTEMLWRAFASDINDNMIDSGMPPPQTYIQPHDIEIPKALNASPDNVTPPMKPIAVYKDENVTVTATLVDHRPMFPAFAYRFDTADGSVTISGDTNKNDNLIALAKGSDVLIHEVMDKNWAINLFPAKRSPDQEAKLGHLLRAHTPTEDIGPIAQAAGVKMVVLTHFGPPNLPDEQWLKNMHGFDGLVKLGKPLMSIGLPLTK